MIINITRNEYSPDGEYYFPLPWGEYEVTNCLIRGNPYQSKGGSWYYKLPSDAIYGYGRYNPYHEFVFTGQIEVTRRRDDIPAKGWGWRGGDNKWIYLRGEYFLTQQIVAERMISAMVKDVSSIEWKQGRLRIREGRIEWPFSVNEIHGILNGIRGHRRIYNHQVFGDCTILLIERNLKEEKIVIGIVPHPIVNPSCPDDENKRGATVSIVSPDHLNDPVKRWLFWKEVLVCEHPFPGNGD